LSCPNRGGKKTRAAAQTTTSARLRSMTFSMEPAWAWCL
jgi:hypothetical protein